MAAFPTRNAATTAGIVLSLFLTAAMPAVAGPDGIYDMTGTNPADRSPYSGVVTVQKSGDTYAVTWRFGTDETKGVGILDSEDTFAVSYGTPSGHGIALFRAQADGVWSGSWANMNGKAAGTEIWRPQKGGGSARGGSATVPSGAAVPQGKGAIRP